MISTLYASMNLDKETNVATETTSVVSLKPLGWRRDKCQIKQQCEEGKVLTEQRLFNLAKTLDKCCLTESTTECKQPHNPAPICGGPRAVPRESKNRELARCGFA